MTSLELVINKIKQLDAGGAAATKLNYAYASIPIPPTPKGRKLLRALLVEIGRHECELADKKKDDFVKTVNVEKI